MKIGSLFITNVVIAVLTVLLYEVPQYGPENHWAFAVLPILIPLFLILNIAFVIIYGIQFNLKVILSGIVLVLGSKYLNRTVSLDRNESKGEGLSVLSYNVRVFNVYPHLQTEGAQNSKEQLSWLENHPADIKCLQEFYTDTSSVYNSLRRLKQQTPYVHFEPFLVNQKVHKFGMVIFSKFPIIDKGIIRFRRKSNNQVIYADILYKKDTIRIYNFHLQSNIIEENLFENETEFKNKFIRSLKRYAIASEVRSEQVKTLLDHVKSSPYPVILCGDLNEIPYGYIYEEFRKILYNSFEEKGLGFGFTFNGGIPFLRIDNHFYGPQLEIKSFQTMNHIKYSDHYPLLGVYSLKELN